MFKIFIPLIRLSTLCLALEAIASVLKGSSLMGSYPRHQSYRDCPPRLWLSQQAQAPNPSNILRCHPPAFEGRTTTTNPPRMCNPSEPTRQCQTHATVCASTCTGLDLVGGSGTRTPDRHSCAMSLTLH